MGYIIAMVNMKGGVGKTTVTINLAANLAKHYGKRVLIVDLDTQINATLSVMPPVNFATLKQEKRTLRTLIEQVSEGEQSQLKSLDRIIQRNICHIYGLDLLPGDIELYEDFLLSEIIYDRSGGKKQNFAASWQEMENKLIRDILQPVVDQYDLIFMDFSPGDHFITRSGILASDFYIIPAKSEPLSLVGIGILEGRIKQLRESDRSDIQLLGVVLTSLGRASAMADNIKKRLKQDFGGGNLFNTEIPTNVAIARAVDEYKPVILTEPQSLGAKAFNNLAEEFIERFYYLKR